MVNYQMTLERILKNNSSIYTGDVKNILILYMEKVIYIGDFSTKADKLRYFKSFFCNAVIDANFINKGGAMIQGDLLKNNPYLDTISSLELEDIDFEKYDIVFCAADNEEELVNFLQEKYSDSATQDQFNLSVFSISALLLVPTDKSKYIFPVNEDLYKQVGIRPGELYLADEERVWSKRWLESRGMKENESLFILLDSTSHSEKLIKTDVYFGYLKFLLKKEHVKVLIFDENCVGKEEAYKEWLEDLYFEKMIFSKGLSLREALCILGADYTKFMFGPCTGLMHCISSIYNNYVNKGMSIEDVPLMITYTGRYDAGDNAHNWWGNAPLINCLLLKERNNEPKLFQFSDLTEEEKRSEDALPCSSYTSKMLIDYTEYLFQRREVPAESL